MTIAFRRYALAICALTITGLIGTIAVNFLIDPYGLWRVVELRGFNEAKSERRNQTHLFKAFDLRKPLPPVLIIGSSRTAYGLDPDHPMLVSLGGAYNAATPGGHLTLIREYLELALSANPGRTKNVILGLDFFEFNSTTFAALPSTHSAARVRPDRPALDDLVAALFTLDALKASFATVLSNHRDPNYQPYHPNGQLTAIDMRRNVETRGMIRRFEMSLDLYLNQATRLRSFRWSEEAFSEFVRIVELCNKNNIDLIIFVPPTHAAHLEAIRAREVWQQFESWKAQVATVTPYWDFSGYNSITTERLKYEMDNYWDISHYRSGVGNLILDRIMGAEMEPGLSDFGYWTTKENIDDALRHAVKNRDEWLEANPELVMLIERSIDDKVD